MPLPTWIPAALSPEAKAFSAACWRAVESQYVAATMTLVDNVDEQALLEEILEETKPPVPAECRNLHYLLFTPFRYSVLQDSRFHMKGEPGVFYASLTERTALAEVTFHRLLFFAESPRTPWPKKLVELTLFSVKVKADKAIDLTRPPFDAAESLWSDPQDYAACQQLAREARERELDAIRYRSVRDPQQGDNIVLLHCRAFAESAPSEMRNWHLRFSEHGVMALREHADDRLQFTPDDFAADPRIAAMNWQR